VLQFLFDPNDQHSNFSTGRRVLSWNALSQLLLGGD
jgi:hypothetical protein